MSSALTLVPPRCFPVKLGTLTFYARSWKLTAVRGLTEQASISGSTYVTNTNLRAKRLELEGHFCFTDTPSEVLVPLDTAIRTQTRFSFALHGVQYVATTLLQFSLEEAAEEGILPCRLALITTNALAAETEESA